MGDVALVVPVLQAVLQKHPDLTITMLTRPAFVPMFQNSERLYCVAADVKNRHKGIPGLYRLYKEILHQYNPDKIIDLHDVMRSWVLDRKSTRLNSSHVAISYAVFCLKKKKHKKATPR